MRRRALLLGGTALAAAGLAGGWPRIERALQEATARHDLRAWLRGFYGEAVARSGAADAFLAEYMQAALRGAAKLEEPDLLRAFAQSTTLAEHAETGALLEHRGLFLPYETPCANVLSAFHAPPGEHG